MGAWDENNLRLLDPSDIDDLEFVTDYLKETGEPMERKLRREVRQEVFEELDWYEIDEYLALLTYLKCDVEGEL